MGNPKKKGFTLLELIIVIVIIGILATLGLTQYANILEKARLAEAMLNITYMRTLATEYYLKNGSLEGILFSDLGVNDLCTPEGYYRYRFQSEPSNINLSAVRCTSGGKSPNASRGYVYYLEYTPGTGIFSWHCYFQDDATSCFGLPD